MAPRKKKIPNTVSKKGKQGDADKDKDNELEQTKKPKQWRTCQMN